MFMLKSRQAQSCFYHSTRHKMPWPLVLTWAVLTWGLARPDGTDDTATQDPTPLPTVFSTPRRPTTANPFAGKLITIPDSCTDLEQPSDQCLTDLMNQEDGIIAFSGGHLRFDDKSCNDEQKASSRQQHGTPSPCPFLLLCRLPQPRKLRYGKRGSARIMVPSNREF